MAPSPPRPSLRRWPTAVPCAASAAALRSSARRCGRVRPAWPISCSSSARSAPSSPRCAASARVPARVARRRPNSATRASRRLARERFRWAESVGRRPREERRGKHAGRVRARLRAVGRRLHCARRRRRLGERCNRASSVAANESLIGAALARISGDVAVASKVAPEAGITGGASGFRRDEVHAACRASLRRLGRDHIDIYFLHWPDESGVPLEETWGAMAELADAGLVRAIGLSNYELDAIEHCHRQRPVDVVQDRLSLIDYLEARPVRALRGARHRGHGLRATGERDPQ